MLLPGYVVQAKSLKNDLLISKALYDIIETVEEYEEFYSHPIKGRKEKIDLKRVF